MKCEELWGLESSGRVDEEEKVALLLGKGVEGVCNKVLEEVGKCIEYWLGR